MRSIWRYRPCRWARSRCSLSVMAGRRLFVAFERGQIALGQAKLACLEQAPHDLAAARLGQVGAELDLLGCHRRAEALAGMAEQLALQRLAGLEAGLERDEGLDHLAGHGVGNADDAA